MVPGDGENSSDVQSLLATAVLTGQASEQLAEKRRRAYRRSVRRQGRKLAGSASYPQRLSVIRGWR